MYSCLDSIHSNNFMNSISAKLFTFPLYSSISAVALIVYFLTFSKVVMMMMTKVLQKLLISDYLLLLQVRDELGEEAHQVQEDDDGPVEVCAVSAPQLARLQRALAGPHLLDCAAEHGHDITEVHWRRGTVGVLVH